MTLSVEHGREPPGDYDALVQEAGSFFHDARWIRALTECFRYPLHWIAAREEGTLVGALPLAEVPALLGPRRLVSLPFSYAVGPLATDGAAAATLMSAAKDLAIERGIRRVEVKSVAGTWEPAPEFHRVEHYSTYRIDTAGGEDDVWRGRLDAGTRRSIRKGEKRNVRAVVGTTEEDWARMADLIGITFRRHGVPSPPRRFWMDTCRLLQRQGLADLYLAVDSGERRTAGIVVWKGRRERIYAFGASDPKHLEERPNHVILWAALREAIAAGVPFDLGRVAPEQTGLLDFKRRWGGEEVRLAYDYWPAARGLNVGRRDSGPLGLAAAVWSRLPLPVTRAGSVLYRYLG